MHVSGRQRARPTRCRPSTILVILTAASIFLFFSVAVSMLGAVSHFGGPSSPTLPRTLATGEGSKMGSHVSQPLPRSQSAAPTAPPSSTPTPAAHSVLRVRATSFNIRYGNADDGPNSWEFRRSAVAETIRSIAPDVIGLQEALHWQYLELLRLLNGEGDSDGGPWGGVFIGRDDGRLAGEGCAVLFLRAALVPAGPAAAFWLSDSPDRPGSVAWGAHLPRMALSVPLRRPPAPAASAAGGGSGGGDDGWRIRVFNTHLDHESPEARRRGAALVLARMREAAAEAGGAGAAAAAAEVAEVQLLCGDMNEGPGDAAVEVLRAGLVDAQLRANPASDGAATFHAWAPDRPRGRRGHIDFIFASDPAAATAAAAGRAAGGGSGGGGKEAAPRGRPALAVRSAAIFTARVQGRMPSDHYPVTADLEWAY